MTKIEQAMDWVAAGMLQTLSTEGWSKPFVGYLNEKDEIWGDHYQPNWTPTTDEFMAHARQKCEDMIQQDGASLLVVGVCICLFRSKGEKKQEFGLGGPGDGSLPKNMEASLQMSGEEAKQAVAVMAVTSGEMSARVYVRDQDKSLRLQAPIQLRLLEATKGLLGDLPWPKVN